MKRTTSCATILTWLAARSRASGILVEVAEPRRERDRLDLHRPRPVMATSLRSKAVAVPKQCQTTPIAKSLSEAQGSLKPFPPLSVGWRHETSLQTPLIVRFRPPMDHWLARRALWRIRALEAARKKEKAAKANRGLDI
jgi:hypothetical protein